MLDILKIGVVLTSSALIIVYLFSILPYFDHVNLGL